MTHAQQTSDELLLRHAAGLLRPAQALVVASHLEMSASSRRLFAALESIGGASLESQPPGSLPDHVFDRTLARIDAAPPDEALPPSKDHRHLAIGTVLPGPLARRVIGPWRRLGPGMRFARVAMPEDPDLNLFLLRVAGGRAMPAHGHSGDEITLVLKGSFHDEQGQYREGDLVVEDEEGEHTPIADAGGECICLTAIEGRLKLRSRLARLVQPLIGF